MILHCGFQLSERFQIAVEKKNAAFQGYLM